MNRINVRQTTRQRFRLRGPLRLLVRLAARDLRNRPGTGLLVLVALLAATTSMTLALVVRGASERPWGETFAMTVGPHVVATSFDADDATKQAMTELPAAPEVVAHAGPYPLLTMPEGALQVHGRRVDVDVVGRDIDPATVDRPALTGGGWVHDGGVVVEESFAKALGLSVGDELTIAGRRFTVAGTAVTTSRQPIPFASPGQVWVTRADAAALAPSAAAQGAVLMLRLADPDGAPAFAATHSTMDEVILEDWESTRSEALTDVQFALYGLIVGSVSLALLAAASVGVAVAGRMTAQSQRSAILKAAGGSPPYIAMIMLGQYLTFALLAGVGGLAAGAYLTPALAHPLASFSASRWV
jgi:putative ABC transport system permease protein